MTPRALLGALLAGALQLSPATAIARAQAAGQSARSPIRWESPVWVGSIGEEDRRLAQLTGAASVTSWLIRPLTRELTPPAPARVVLYYPQSRTRFNSNIPYGMDDGAMWAGRGLSAALDVGVEARWRAISVRVAPTLTWSQNREFVLAQQQFAAANSSPFADQWWASRIDRPQRFGDGAYARVDPGQSKVRVEWRGLAVGAGTESMWWGPGIDNSILMTNNAAGFPHAFVGTSHPVNVWIGRLEGMYLAGRLYDSDYWRLGVQPNRNRRWLGALVFVLEPRGAPGLYLGGGRVFYQYVPPDGIGFGELFDILQPFTKVKVATPDNPLGNDSADQLLALFARWVFPEVGFEVYGEWGRNDHNVDFRDLVLQPDHASGFVLGFQKAFQRTARGFLVLRGELTALGEGRTAEVRPAPPWYAHHIVFQGYTQRGQIVGAGIGPGSDMQKLEANWHAEGWTGGAFVERVRIDADGFYRFFAPLGLAPSSFRWMDAILGVGVRGKYDFRRVRLTGSVFRGLERNRYTILQNDVPNLSADVRLEFRVP
ncbi:MAG TPA: capsule assembly Wzi family protein [Gemmatimonadaceae bacterium]|nr:capsule assembly Wzi family protein [Gemmatimonadaceae bacterium]